MANMTETGIRESPRGPLFMADSCLETCLEMVIKVAIPICAVLAHVDVKYKYVLCPCPKSVNQIESLDPK